MDNLPNFLHISYLINNLRSYQVTRSENSKILILYNSPLLDYLCDSNSVGSSRNFNRRFIKSNNSKNNWANYIIWFNATMDTSFSLSYIRKKSNVETSSWRFQGLPSIKEKSLVFKMVCNYCYYFDWYFCFYLFCIA